MARVSEQSRVDAGPKKVLLALQGGAAFGAFGWGVLDRLLADDRIEIEGVSGTSSGAVNAALLAYGLIGQDRAEAQTLLETFWRRISAASEARRWGRLRSLSLLGARLFHIHRKDVFLDVMSRLLLPYRFDPATMDPLRGVLDEVIDFDRLRAADAIKLFINATHVATTTNRVFARNEVSLDALCASCCLPFLFDAVEVDGERYWDGGYMGNPTIYPLIYDCSSHDIIVVLTSDLGARALPQTAAETLNRVSEVSFASTLMREMRAIHFVTRLLDNGWISPEANLRRMNIHVIAPPGDADVFNGATMNLSAEWDHVKRMREHGHEATDAWLAACFDSIGHCSTVDMEARFG